MPYKSKAQRAYVHAKASEGEGWAKKYAREADKMKQPTKAKVKSKYRKVK